MSAMIRLSALALRPLLQGALGPVGDAAALGAGPLALVLADRFVDQSQRLTAALQTANERAWKTLEVALAGESLWGWLDPAEDRAFRQQVRAFLDAATVAGFTDQGAEYRQACLRELREARRAGLLTGGPLEPKTLAERTADFSRFGDPQSLLDAEWQAVEMLAADLHQAGHLTLAHFLKLRPTADVPLLVVAVRYFFRRRVEADEVLARGLAFARMERLAETQEAAFAGLDEALTKNGHRLDEVLGVVHEVRAGVLDIQSELGKQGHQIQELGQSILRALRQQQLDRRELRAQDSLSLRSEAERLLVRQLVASYRSLPPDQRQQLPALLNAVGKLQIMAGDFESAQRDFQDVAVLAPEPSAQAEARYHAYRAALERRRWDEALSEFRLAMTLDPRRFAPFPLDRLEPQRILGAGGFGVVFLCRHRFLSAPIVIKALWTDDLDRGVDEVFAEAQALQQVNHPAVIRVTDCAYADPAGKRHPYLTMDFFDGVSLDEHVRVHGPLSANDLLEVAWQMAEGLKAAHERGILHRDVKPANVLVRKDGHKWHVKLIDFGLAVRRQVVHSTISNADALHKTLAGSSIAGTLDYAAPEQMGKLPGVPVGPQADVYGFGKTCCYALFRTPQPRRQHWQQVPAALAELLDSCLEEAPADRPGTFGTVLSRLADASPVAEPVLAGAEPPSMKGDPSLTLRAQKVSSGRNEPGPRQAVPPPPASTETRWALALREEIVRLLVDWAGWQTVVRRLVIAGSIATPVGLGLGILFFIIFVSSGEPDPKPLLVFGLISVFVGGVLGPIVFGLAWLFHRGGNRTQQLQDLARAVLARYPDALPLGVEGTRWTPEAGWDLVYFLEKHVPKAVTARFRFKGKWLQEMGCKVHLNGRFLGGGDTKAGFDFPSHLPVGTHQITIKWENDDLAPLRRRVELTKEGDCEVECKITQVEMMKTNVHYF